MGWKRRVIDALISPAVLLGALPLKLVRSLGIADFPLSKAALFKVGIFPIRNHFYEPQFDTRHLPRATKARELPGIDFRFSSQRQLLSEFEVDGILRNLPGRAADELGYGLGNTQFGPGDAELWYHVIQHFRPAKIIEIGSGHSTRLARLALAQIASADPTYRCEHTCIEPFRMPWLERLDVHVIRRKVEEVDRVVFGGLQPNDILFIDSTHMIRPGGDVLFEYLQLLPTLPSGVIVHIHDIFSPRDYPDQWVREDILFWNEQYLLEAFLTHNRDWAVLLAANYLKHESFDLLQSKCPHLTKRHEPGSFYLRRV